MLTIEALLVGFGLVVFGVAVRQLRAIARDARERRRDARRARRLQQDRPS